MLRVSDKVSDLIFSPGRPPQIELAGKLQPVDIPGLEKLTPAHTAGIAKLMIGNHQNAVESLEKSGSADLSFSVPGEGRFRVNIFKQRGTHAIVMRVIPMRPPNFSDFNLPEQLKEIVDIKNGMVLVTGPTGSGKSSTLAAIIDLINETEVLPHRHYRRSDRVSSSPQELDQFINENCIRTRRILPSLCERLCGKRLK